MVPAELSFLPLAALLDELALQGLPIPPDLQLRMGKYLALHGPQPHDLQGWKYRLSALLCYEQRQQDLFYDVFDRVWSRWVEQLGDTENELPPTPLPDGAKSASGLPAYLPDKPIRPKEHTYYAPPPTTGRSGPIRSALSFQPGVTRFWNTALLDRAMPAWREKEWAPIRDWHIEASIQATIRAGGLPTLVSQARRLTPQYLVLIEEWTPKDHVAGLYADLCAEWRRRDLTVEWFFYDNTPARCWRNRREPSSYTYLERLMGEYEGYKLILIGEPEGLLDLPDLRPSSLLVDAVDVFRDVAFLCTRSTAHWGQSERALFQLIPVAPATPEGIASLPRQWSEDTRLTVRHWQSEQPEPSLPSLDRDDEQPIELLIADLKAYLGRNAYLWLCATAVYPELYYELTALLNDESIQPNPNLPEWDQNRIWLNALIRLSKLSWFRRGELPRELREQLRHALPPDQARAVRRQILDVLNRQTAPPSGSYAAADRVFTEMWLEHEAALAAVSTPEDQQILVDIFRQQMADISLADVEDSAGRHYLTSIGTQPTSPDPNFKVLWVDDSPEKNEGLRDYLTRTYWVSFKLALDTESALRQIQLTAFDLVITDFSRKTEPRAAYILLQGLRATGRKTLATVFTSSKIKQQEESMLLSAGANAVHDEGNKLIEWIGQRALPREQASTTPDEPSGQPWSASLQEKTRRTLRDLAQRSRNQDIRSLLDMTGISPEEYGYILSELDEIWMRKYVDDNQIDQLADRLAELIFNLPLAPNDFSSALGALTQDMAGESGSESPTTEQAPETSPPERDPRSELDNIHRLIAINRIGEALAASRSLSEYLSLPSTTQPLLLLQGQHNKLESDNRLGIIESSFYQQQYNLIRVRLLSLLKEMEKYLNPPTTEAPETPPEAAPQAQAAEEPDSALEVLFLAATPDAASQAQTSAAREELEDMLSGSENLAFSEINGLKTAHDLQQFLSTSAAQVLHFTAAPPPSEPPRKQISKLEVKAAAPNMPPEPGIYVLNERGQKALVPPAVLAELLGRFTHLQAIVLYGCFSESQAQAVSLALPDTYIIGLRLLPRDEAPMAFARGFYLNLASTQHYQSAIEYGIQQILAYNEPEDRVVVLLGGSPLNLAPVEA